MTRATLALVWLLPALLSGPSGCEDADRTTPAGGGSSCACEPDCPEGTCDLEILLDETSCARPVQLVVAGDEAGELQPGETYRSCSLTWEVGERIEYGTVPGTSPYFPTESRSCTEAVDHIRATWRCSR